MNWSKIKSIMIYFLIAMNIFMVAFITLSALKESSVPQEVIDSCHEILEKDGFTATKEIIPSATYKLPVLGASFYSASDLSEIFFKKQLAFRTSGNSLVANNGSLTLTVSQNSFIYESGNSIDEAYTEREIKKALKKMGFDMTGAVYDEKERCFYRMYSGVNLYNMYIKAELDSFGNICYVSAMWPGKLTVQEEKALSFSSSVISLKEFFPHKGKITLIEHGYSLHPHPGGKFTFVPAWRVRVGNELKIIE